MIAYALVFAAGLACGATVLYTWTKRQLASVQKAASAAAQNIVKKV